MVSVLQGGGVVRTNTLGTLRFVFTSTIQNVAKVMYWAAYDTSSGVRYPAVVT